HWTATTASGYAATSAYRSSVARQRGYVWVRRGEPAPRSVEGRDEEPSRVPSGYGRLGDEADHQPEQQPVDDGQDALPPCARAGPTPRPSGQFHRPTGGMLYVYFRGPVAYHLPAPSPGGKPLGCRPRHWPPAAFAPCSKRGCIPVDTVHGVLHGGD